MSTIIKYIYTLALSVWNTCSAANNVCKLVTRKRTRESYKAGSSSWSSELSCSYVRLASSNNSFPRETLSSSRFLGLHCSDWKLCLWLS